MAKRPNLAVVGGPGPADQTPGHNSKLSEEQEKGLHLSSHVPLYERTLKAKKEADAAFKNACKQIKSEGGSVEDIKLTIQLRTPAGEAKFKELLERQRRIADWNNLAVGSQGWLLDEDRRPLVDRAKKDGEKAGLEGADCKSPHAPGTEANEAWIEGWHKSQAVLAAGFKKKDDGGLVKNPNAAKPAGVDDFDKSASADGSDRSTRWQGSQPTSSSEAASHHGCSCRRTTPAGRG